MKDHVTIKEASAETGLSQYYLRKRAREGSIPVIRVGTDEKGTYMIHLEELREQLARERREREAG